MTKLSEWSRQVKERDAVCKHCGTAEDLHAHHVVPKSVAPDLALDVSNGIALCYRCHKRAHEGARLPRSRSDRPQRRTLQAQLADARKRIKALELELDRTQVMLKAERAEVRQLRAESYFRVKKSGLQPESTR